MPDLRRLKTFVKASDLQKGDTVTFVDAGEIKDVDFSKTKDGSNLKTVLEITIRVNDTEPKKFVPNSTTLQYLQAKWGPDTGTWVGRTAKVNFTKQNSFGKLTDVIFLEPDDVEWDARL